MSRHEAEMWAEAMEHIGHSTDCPTCHGDYLWKPDDLNALLDEDIAAKHTGEDDCPCLACSVLRAVQAEAALKSPWCGTCNPAARVLITGSPEYRRWFNERLREGGDMDGIPVPAPYDPTVTP